MAPAKSMRYRKKGIREVPLKKSCWGKKTVPHMRRKAISRMEGLKGNRNGPNAPVSSKEANACVQF